MPSSKTPFGNIVAVPAEEFLDAVGAKGGFDLALIHVDADRGRFTAVKRSLKALGDFDRRANLFVGDLIGVIGRGGDDLDGFQLPDACNDIRGILAAEDHDSVGFLLCLPDEICRHIAETDGEHGKKKQRHDDGGDEGAAVAQRFGEFLAIDDADIAQAHGQSFSAET